MNKQAEFNLVHLLRPELSLIHTFLLFAWSETGCPLVRNQSPQVRLLQRLLSLSFVLLPRTDGFSWLFWCCSGGWIPALLPHGDWNYKRQLSQSFEIREHFSQWSDEESAGLPERGVSRPWKHSFHREEIPLRALPLHRWFSCSGWWRVVVTDALQSLLSIALQRAVSGWIARCVSTVSRSEMMLRWSDGNLFLIDFITSAMYSVRKVEKGW